MSSYENIIKEYKKLYPSGYMRKFSLYPTDEIVKDYAMCVEPEGEKILLYICKEGGYTESIKNDKIIENIPKEYDKTILEGYLYSMGSYHFFTSTDILYMKGEDVKKYSLSKRIKLLKDLCEKIPECKQVTYYRNSINKINNKSILYIPIKANYKNVLSYVYKDINSLIIILEIERRKGEYDMYSLKVEGKIFKGSEKYYFNGYIPLTDKDRELSGNVKFRWSNNRLIPICKTEIKQTKEEVIKIWNMINNY